MKLLEINARSQELLTCLCQVWESSVRATHHFLSEEDIRSLAVYVPPVSYTHLTLPTN